MRRVVCAVVVFLLVGAAINVAVAWGCALWSPLRRAVFAAHAEGESIGSLGRVVPEDWPKPRPGERTTHEIQVGFGRRVHRLYVPPPPFPLPPGGSAAQRPPPVRYVHAQEVGWPLACFGSHADSTDYDPPEDARLRPIWVGFAGNTLLYGAACWTLFGGPFTVRRWRRERRGLCLKCAYPVRGLEKCPECGREMGGGAGGSGGAGASGGARVAGGVEVLARMGLGSARGEGRGP